MQSPCDIEEAITIISSFIQSYVKNAGNPKVIIGLSGGIDSACVAVLCKQTLGKNKIHCLFLPESTTPQEDRKHQSLLCSHFDLPCSEISITPTVDHIADHLPFKLDKYSLANIKARVRMVHLYAYANHHCGLVCGTSNKSELLVGYCTKYGDGAVDLQPLGDLYKTQVYHLAQHLGIPDSIISKKPTAGLWPGQLDEKELGCCYKDLDGILYGLEQKLPLKTIADKIEISLDLVKRIQHLRKQSEHKRHTPLIPKLGIRTPGLDWRSPIQEG